jgi:oligopeptide transport system ATP-binding protein
MTTSILALEELTKLYDGRDGPIRAVDGVTLDVRPGETLALVGESGCGKSTIARLTLGLATPTSGRILFQGQDIGRLSARAMKSMRRNLQFIFQDPFSALDPRMTAGASVTEPLAIHGLIPGRMERRGIAARLLEAVGLAARHVDRWPRQFSGGQRQRIGIARAFALKPALIVADEPVSALDVSIRSQVVNLLQDLQEEQGTAYLFISHDMPTVRHIADRVAVMYLGRIVEIASKADFFAAPYHPYSQALLASVPRPHPRRPRNRLLLTGDPPNPAAMPPGCRFHTRCPIARPRCREEAPLPRPLDGRVVECHFAAPLPVGLAPSSSGSVPI